MTEEDNDAVRRQDVLRRLYTASVLCALFMIIELVGGYYANSLAIMSDAAHLFADLAAFVVSIGASHLASLPGTRKYTYGLKRMESLAALFSMVSLALICVYLAIEAITRIKHFVDGTLEEVDGRFMSLIAAIGVMFNVALAFVLGGAHPELPGGGHDHDHEHGDHFGAGHNVHGQHDHDHDHGHDDYDHGSHDHATASHECESTPLIVNESLHSDEVAPSTAAAAAAKKKEERNVNLQAAYLHVLGDLLQSFAVLIAGLIIWLVPSPKVRIVDPIATLLFCFLVFYSTIGVIRSSVAVILEEVPPDVSWDQVYEDISNVDGVTNVHDLHIWSISHGVPALSVHCRALDPEKALTEILDSVCTKHNIAHPTVQVQRDTGGGPVPYLTKQCYNSER